MKRDESINSLYEILQRYGVYDVKKYDRSHTYYLATYDMTGLKRDLQQFGLRGVKIHEVMSGVVVLNIPKQMSDYERRAYRVFVKITYALAMLINLYYLFLHGSPGVVIVALAMSILSMLFILEVRDAR